MDKPSAEGELLRIGVPVIINDCDAPEARLVAVLTRYDAKEGIWHAEYLSTYPHMRNCYTDRRPTPISEFGMRLEWDGRSYRCVPTGGPCIAKYHDGVPRNWQDRQPNRWWASRVSRRVLSVDRPRESAEATP